MRIYTNFHQLWQLVGMMFLVLLGCSYSFRRVNSDTNMLKNILGEKNLLSQDRFL